MHCLKLEAPAKAKAAEGRKLLEGDSDSESSSFVSSPEKFRRRLTHQGVRGPADRGGGIPVPCRISTAAKLDIAVSRIRVGREPPALNTWSLRLR